MATAPGRVPGSLAPAASEPTAQHHHSVVVISADAEYRALVVDALRVDGARATDAPLAIASLSMLEGWHVPWRSLADVAAVVLDITNDAELGLSVLDAVRRRDWSIPVVLLVRTFGMLAGARFGANLVLEGRIDPGELAATVMALMPGPFEGADAPGLALAPRRAPSG